MIYTLYRPIVGAYLTLSLISRISSTPLLLAASISNTSELEPFVMVVQLTHSLQGSSVG